MTYRVLHLLDHSWPILEVQPEKQKYRRFELQIGMQPHVLTGPPS